MAKCAHCGEAIHQVPGGRGPLWVNPWGYVACLCGTVPHPHSPQEETARAVMADQRSTYEQVKDLMVYARKQGMYDAEDWLVQQWPALTSAESELGRNRRLGRALDADA
jgi:predicted SAM-dependent methyltransferase